MLKVASFVIAMMPMLVSSHASWPPDASSAISYCDARSQQLLSIIRMMQEDELSYLSLEGLESKTVVARANHGEETSVLGKERNGVYVELLTSMDIGESFLNDGIGRIRIGYRSRDDALIEVFCATGDLNSFENCEEKPSFETCGQCVVPARTSQVLYYWGTDEYVGQRECVEDDA